MYRGKVTAVDASGVYVQTAEYGTLGPCQAVVANYAVADMVLCVNVGDEASPELVVVGLLTTSATTTFNDITTSKASPTWRVNATSGTCTVALDAVNGQSARFVFSTGASQRWIVHKTATSESGSNAGSDFVFNRRDDSGGSLGDALTLRRSSGKITVHTVGATAGIELGTGGPRIMSGTGSPESVVTAPVGSLWLRTDSSTTLYVKQTGTGNTGWIAK